MQLVDKINKYFYGIKSPQHLLNRYDHWDDYDKKALEVIRRKPINASSDNNIVHAAGAIYFHLDHEYIKFCLPKIMKCKITTPQEEVFAVHSIIFELSNVEEWEYFYSRWRGFTSEQYDCTIEWLEWILNYPDEYMSNISLEENPLTLSISTLTKLTDDLNIS